MTTWQAREGVMGDWQRIVYEKSERLVRVHAAIGALERRQEAIVSVDVAAGTGEVVSVGLVRSHLVALLKAQEADITKDLARILRQVSE
jgi:hypothetical protein